MRYTRHYEVRVEGHEELLGFLGQGVDKEDLQDKLLDACSRYRDIGHEGGEIYLVEWLVDRRGNTSLDWMLKSDVDEDAKIVIGPVYWKCSETGWMVDE